VTWYWIREADSLVIRDDPYGDDGDGEYGEGDYVAEIDVRYMSPSSPDFGQATQNATEIVNAHNALKVTP
jgi:hypothetical protein